MTQNAAGEDEPADVDFPFAISGPTSEQFSLNTQDDGNPAISQTYTVDAGSYSIGETLPNGWILDDAACRGAEVTRTRTGVSFDVADGADVICRFTNKATQSTGTIIIQKNVGNNYGETFNYSGDLGNFEITPPNGTGSTKKW